MRERAKPGALLREIEQLKRDRQSESGIRSEVLATFRRGDTEELRLSFDSKPGDDGGVITWVSARIWWRGNDGQMRPSKKGVTFRMRELGEVIARLEDAAERGRR